LVQIYTHKTAEEKAVEWGVTVNHVQYLCRKGKIEGAVKRAGAWFIPDDAPIPAKKSGDGAGPFAFTRTKEEIFNNSIKLFTQSGYENVSMNDIADAVGIRQSAVYNHFKNKYEILDTIYDFYYYHYISNRQNPDDLETVLQTGSLTDIITKGFIYEFDKSVLERMADITRIIVQRATTDERAAELFKKLLLEEGIGFVEDGLCSAVEAGRLASFDTHTVAVLVNCVRLYSLLWWLVDQTGEKHMKKVTKDELAMYEHIAMLLTDLKKGAP
jgi:AcrR family transcriptional regulator